MTKCRKMNSEVEFSLFHEPSIEELSDTTLRKEEMQNFLNNQGFNFQSWKTENLELDLYEEKLKTGIEYNNEWYSSEQFIDKKYQLTKMQECRRLGIKLLMFNDVGEWQNRNFQVRNFLLGSLGVFKRRVYARQCEVRKLDPPYREFLERYHIQGPPIRITAMYGLFYKNEMIGAVTYAPHHRQLSQMTLNRLCFLAGTQCIGGASKLVKNSLEMEGFDDVITWSDCRWTEGSIYEKLGFKFEEQLGIDYSYTNGRRVTSKQSMKKGATGCPEGLTEREWCLQNGWHRLWDYGKKRWRWVKSSCE